MSSNKVEREWTAEELDRALQEESDMSNGQQIALLEFLAQCTRLYMEFEKRASTAMMTDAYSQGYVNALCDLRDAMRDGGRDDGT